MQLIAGPRQAAAHCPQRTTQLRRGLLVGQALPVAERHDGAVFLREPPDFFLNDRAELGVIGRPFVRGESTVCTTRKAPRRSVARRRAASTRARAATRHATPYNQLPSDSSRRIEPARFTRIRKVA